MLRTQPASTADRYNKSGRIRNSRQHDLAGVGMGAGEDILTHTGTARSRYTRKHVEPYGRTLDLDHSEATGPTADSRHH